jgi:alanyl-tRNA synthetase
VLGDHVTQKGSLVAPDRLRFDFSHNQPVTHEEVTWIEDMVNKEIRSNVHADVRHMSYDEAIDFGAMALFGEKYGDTVRVMKFGDFSTELCGGTHVSRTGDIGLFRIIGESGVAAGIRRIEAVTGDGALRYVREEQEKLDAVAAVLKTGRDDAVSRVQQLVARTRELEKELSALRAKLASGQGSDLASQAVEVEGLKVIAARVDGADAGTLRDAVDQLKNKLGSGVVVLGSVDGGKVRLAAGATKDVSKKVPAGKLVNSVAEQVGGRGGGRPDFAQAGGSEPGKLDAALESVRDWVAAQLKQ